MTDRLTIRLGPLRGPLTHSAAENGISVSQEARRRLAASYGLTEPSMKPGPKPATDTQGETK